MDGGGIDKYNPVTKEFYHFSERTLMNLGPREQRAGLRPWPASRTA
jgi:hypothetical protein